MYEDEIRKLIQTKKILFGKEEVLKNIRKGLIAKVYVAVNAPLDAKKDIVTYQKISGYELLETELPNDELGIVCKKPFPIAIIGILK